MSDADQPPRGSPPRGPHLTVVGLPSEVEVTPGADLAGLVAEAAAAAGVTLADDDVLAVASKVVAKAEGAFARLPAAPDVHAARRLLAREQARRVVAETPAVLVVETRHGLVCANAGIDTSNIAGDGEALLLPHDPDASAASLRSSLRERLGASPGVVVTDTFGRPWRLGQTDVAIGAAGISVLRDDRGGVDRHGRPLGVTMAAVGDALAAAADLVRRKHDGTPFVLLRGLAVAGDGTGADLVRPSHEDMFRTGGATAALAALVAGAAARTPTPAATPTPPPAAVVAAARTAVVEHTGDACEVALTDDGTLLLRGTGVELGAARTAVLVVAAAHDLAALVEETAGGLRVTLLDDGG